MAENQMQGPTRAVSVSVTALARDAGTVLGTLADTVGGLQVRFANTLGPVTVSMYDPSSWEDEVEFEDGQGNLLTADHRRHEHVSVLPDVEPEVGDTLERLGDLLRMRQDQGVRDADGYVVVRAEDIRAVLGWDRDPEDRYEAQPDAAEEGTDEGWQAAAAEGPAEATPPVLANTGGILVTSLGVDVEHQRDWRIADWLEYLAPLASGHVQQAVAAGGTLNTVALVFRKVEGVWHPQWRFESASSS